MGLVLLNYWNFLMFLTFLKVFTNVFQILTYVYVSRFTFLDIYCTTQLFTIRFENETRIYS